MLTISPENIQQHGTSPTIGDSSAAPVRADGVSNVADRPRSIVTACLVAALLVFSLANYHRTASTLICPVESLRVLGAL